MDGVFIHAIRVKGTGPFVKNQEVYLQNGTIKIPLWVTGLRVCEIAQNFFCESAIVPLYARACINEAPSGGRLG